MGFTSVRKRNGEVINFDEARIKKAILKALQSTKEGGEKEAEKITEKVIKELRVPAEEKGLTVTFQNNAENNLFVLADINRTREILINLIGNSIKFTRSGGITIDCRQRNNYIEAKIADTGIGIPKEDQAKIFSRLFRAKNAKEKLTEGTGLGLYIIQLAVEKLGGKVWFESIENGGTTFYVSIPLKGIKKISGLKLKV